MVVDKDKAIMDLVQTVARVDEKLDGLKEQLTGVRQAMSESKAATDKALGEIDSRLDAVEQDVAVLTRAAKLGRAVAMVVFSSFVGFVVWLIKGALT